MKDNNLYYRFIRKLCFLIKYLFRVKVYGSELIPNKGRVILAGRHISIFDPEIILTTTKRHIHFLAKKEILEFPSNIIFKKMGLIPVDRKKHAKEALDEAIKYLNNDLVIGIFPEGTTEKGRGYLPFKTGAVKMAKETDSLIVPFTIKGKFIPIFGSIKLIFGKPYKVKGNIDLETNKLRDIIINLKEG